MSYEFQDPSKIEVYLPNVLKGYSSELDSDLSFDTEFFEDFSSDLPLYTDGVAASGDQLPWGVAAVWQGVDYTDKGQPGTKFADADQITNPGWAVGGGISKWVLKNGGKDANGNADVNQPVDKFAIVIDSGVNKLNDFYIGNVSNALSYSFVDTNYDGILDTEDPFKDDNGHGTHVAGTIAAKADGKGVVGVAPGAEIISMKVFGASGGTTVDTIMNAVTQSIEYITKDSVTIKGSTVDTSMLNFDNTVINMSLGGGYYQPLITLIDNAATSGVKFSVAAGNSNKDVDSVSPAAAGDNSNVYTISAVDKKYKMASFTNWDDPTGTDDVDYAAPGVNVLSYKNAAGTLDWWSGTSMAAPAVAGLLLMTDYNSYGGGLANDANGNPIQGIQAGENSFTNDSMPGPYVDPFALTTLSAYENTSPTEPKDPGTGDDNPNNDTSPWDGYLPDKLYYKTSGLASGVNGTYSMSTGYGATNQSSLESDLSIESGKLDQSMASLDNPSQTKSAINATEGSGVKLTGYAYEGDQISFNYTLSSNDYVPYNDYAFVQVKSGDALGTSPSIKTSLKSLGAIGLDVVDKGSKSGSFSYTFTKEDFNNNTLNTAGVDDGKGVQGYFDLSVGVTDAIDTWVNTSLLVQALTKTKAGEVPSPVDNSTYTKDVLTWAGANTLGNNNGEGSGTGTASMNTGLGSTGQGIIEAVLGIDPGSLDTGLNGTKSAIDATEGSATYFTTKAKVGQILSFEALFSTNDYDPYNDFSYYTLNDKVYNLISLGQDASDFGTVEKQVNITLDSTNLKDIGEDQYGKLKVGFGISDALDWCVDSNLEIKKVKIQNASDKAAEETAGAADKVTNKAKGFNELTTTLYGNASSDASKNAQNALTSSPTYIDLSTNYSALKTQSQLEFAAKIKNGTLDTSLNGTKSSINATSGSAIVTTGVGAVGDVISFEFEFKSDDYNPYQDFAYVSFNGDTYTLQDNTDTGTPASMAYAMVNGPQGSSNLDGKFSYTITKDDLKGSNVDDITMSVGIINALDNAVTSTLKLKNLEYTPSGVTDAAGFIGTDYLDKFQSTYQTYGDVWVENDSYGTFQLKTGGCVSNAVSQSTLEGAMGVSNGLLDQQMYIYGATGSSIYKSKINATEGSLVTFENKAAVGDTVSFQYDFVTDDYTPYADFSFFNIGNTTQMIAGVGTNVANFGSKSGLVTYTVTEQDLTGIDSATNLGDFKLNVGIVDALDTYVNSTIDIWDFTVSGAGDSIPSEGSGGAKAGNETQESDYEEINVSMIGNTFQQQDAMVMSTAGGSVDQISIETALGIKSGGLDGTLGGTKTAANATEGSAAYDTVNVNVGDVISFGYTMGTDDYIPYQDFAFVSFNGNVSALATVGEECPEYGEISDVFNYVVTSNDLKGDTSGIVTIGVGIMDVEDSYVDSFIEVYDFEISGDAKEDDKAADGIVDGAGAYAISTALQSGSNFSTANTSTVKLSGIYGNELVSLSADTSLDWDIAAAMASDPNAPGASAGGYSVLFKGTGAYTGKWGAGQTTSDGILTSGIYPQNFLNAEAAVGANWEAVFGIDIDGDSIISSSYDNLTLYSANTGAIKIKEVDTVGNATYYGNDFAANVLAATPSKADFGTFTGAAETYKILVKGSGQDSDKFQVWTTSKDGTVISKNGYTDYSTNPATQSSYYTVTQAVSDGLENTFSKDLDANGLISGGSNIVLEGKKGGLNLKNIKGETISENNLADYSIIASEIQIDDSFYVLLKGTGAKYTDLYSIWNVNKSGKVTNENQWFTETELQANDYESYFNVDANADNYVGKKQQISTVGAYDLSLGPNGIAVVTDDKGSIFNVTKNGSNVQTVTPDNSFSMYGAAKYDNKNWILWLNNFDYSAVLWEMTLDWAYTSEVSYAVNTEGYFTIEGLINADLNNDGIIPVVDENGNLNINSSKTVDSTGDTIAGYGLSGAVFVAANEAASQGFSLKLKSGDPLKSTYLGANLIGAESLQYQNTPTMSAAYKQSDNTLDVFLFDGDGTATNNFKVNDKTEPYFYFESTYNQDLNNDNIIGKGQATLESNGEESVVYNEYGAVAVNDGISNKVIKDQFGNQVNKQIGDFSLVEAETDAQGLNWVVYKNSNNAVDVWVMDENWTKTNSFAAESSAYNYTDIESAFSKDLNGDTIIGLDANKNGFFDNDDLVAQKIDANGSVFLQKDINNQLYAGSVDNSIFIDGNKVNTNFVAGWEILGVETYIDNASQASNNFMCIQSKFDKSQYSLVTFGNDWNYESGIDQWFTTNEGSDLFNFAEVAMIQDLNNNAQIGI